VVPGDRVVWKGLTGIVEEVKEGEVLIYWGIADNHRYTTWVLIKELDNG
jgi:uncharacterized protein YkvS